MKTLLRSFALPCLLILSGSPARSATPEPDNLQTILAALRSDLNGYKVRTLNEVMELTGPEAEKFWPLYQKYESELARLGDRRLEAIREFLELEAAGTWEEKPWKDLGQRVLRNREDLVALWKKYHRQISKALSPYRAAQFLQVEHQIALFIDLSIASEMPVLGRKVAPAEVETVAGTPTRKDMALVSTRAVVSAVDLEKRQVTLTDALGRTETLKVDERVRRLGEVKAGDEVQADYYVSVVYELRPPTAEESREPLVIAEGAGRAPEGTSPGASGLRRIRAVCTIEGLDRPTETVTLKGPLGRFVAVRAARPDTLSGLRIGETVVVTYTEALAISLKKT